MDRYLESASRDQASSSTRRSDAWARSHFDVDLDGGFQNRVHRRRDVMLDCLTASCSALQCQLDKVGLQYRNVSSLTDEGSSEDGRGQDPFVAGSYRINSATWKDWETTLDTGGVVWSGALHTHIMHAGSLGTGDTKGRRDADADCSIRAIR